MATSTIDGIVEEAVLKRRRAQASLYERVVFRLDDGTTKTWAKAVVLNDVADLVVPGTRGRFYLFTAIDHRGISGVRTVDGRAASGVPKVNEKASIWVIAMMTVLNAVYVLALDKISILALVLMILGVPMYFLYRQVRVDAERHFAADAGYRPAPAAA
jgi:hypothetical protein